MRLSTSLVFAPRSNRWAWIASCVARSRLARAPCVLRMVSYQIRPLLSSNYLPAATLRVEASLMRKNWPRQPELR